MPKTKNNLVLTGGHAATTAMALVEALKEKLSKNATISWIGTKNAVEGKKGLTLEFKTFHALGINCYAITTGRVQRKFTRHTIFSLLKIPLGFVHALWLILKIRPDAIVSFGGFAAFPVVVWGRLLGVPVVIHEQTTAIGMANKYSVPFAAKVAISRDESRKYYPKNKIVLTGNPVRKAFFEIPAKAKMAVPPTIYATGGSRGSQNFNAKLLEILPSVLDEFKVIHQCGDFDYELFTTFKDSLMGFKKDHYEVHSTIDPLKVPQILKIADIVIGRAGANTVSEVIAARRPAIFIPIPWSQNDEQTKNAKLMEAEGMAIVLNQNDMSSESFLKAIHQIKADYGKYALHSDSDLRELDRQAAEKLALLALSL